MSLVCDGCGNYCYVPDDLEDDNLISYAIRKYNWQWTDLPSENRKVLLCSDCFVNNDGKLDTIRLV